MTGGNYWGRAWRYCQERFNFGQFIPLALILAGTLAVGSQSFLGEGIKVDKIILAAAALFLFLFRLRIFDEFKDHEHDLKYYPERPLPRGLVSKAELKKLLVPLIAAELIIAFIFGRTAFFFFGWAFIYSLVMLKEFYVPAWLKSHFTVYIITHEILLFPLFFYVSALNGFKLTDLAEPFFWFLVIFSGLAMFILEVTRKVRPRELENASQDTYTAQYGLAGATRLLVLLSLALSASFGKLVFILKLKHLGLLFLPIAGLSLFFWYLYQFNRQPNALTAKKVFFSSIFFVFMACLSAIALLLSR